MKNEICTNCGQPRELHREFDPYGVAVVDCDDFNPYRWVLTSEAMPTESGRYWVAWQNYDTGHIGRSLELFREVDVEYWPYRFIAWYSRPVEEWAPPPFEPVTK